MVGEGAGNELTPSPVSRHTWGASVQVQTHRLHLRKEPAFFQTFTVARFLLKTVGCHAEALVSAGKLAGVRAQASVSEMC